MNRRTRTLIVVGVAVALASLASFGVYRTIQKMPVKEVAIAERYAVVASQTVPVGLLLTKDMVRTVPWPAEHPVAGGFASVDEVIGRGVTAGLVENEPITENKLAPKNSGGGLTTTITQGMRAMSVKVNDVIGVAGFTVPGTHVDVVVTINSDRESISRTVLSNVQVLTAGTKFDADKSRDGTPIPNTTVVTLLVTPPDAERLALATTQGQIVLVLRNPLDTEPTKTTGVRTSGLISSPDAAPVKTMVQGRPRVVAPPLPPPEPKRTVEVIRADKRTEEVIKK